MTQRPLDIGVGQAWETLVSAAPGDRVLVDPTGAAWSRAEVAEVLRRFATWWSAQAPGPVAVVGAYTPEAALLVHAASWSGRPTLVLPPELPEVDAARLCERAGVVARVTPARMEDPDFWTEVSAASPIGAWPAVDPEADALMLLSSGTTSAGRLVRLSHRALMAAVRRSAVGQGGRRVGISTGIHTITGARFALLYPALLGGASVWLPERAAPLELVEAAGAVDVLIVGAGFVHAALAGGARFVEAMRASAVRLVVGGGGPMAAEVRGRFAETFGVPLAWTYGMTESAGGLVSAWARPGEAPEPGTGRPTADMLLLDEHGDPVAPGAVGEVVLAGDTMFSGYVGGGGVGGTFATGDLGSLDADGFLHLAGRRDRRFIDPAGDKVFLDEVETVLSAQTGRRCHVAAVGGERPWLAAIVEGAPIAEATLRRGLGAALPVRAIPKRFCFADALPTGRTGKVDRAAAHALLESSCAS